MSTRIAKVLSTGRRHRAVAPVKAAEPRLDALREQIAALRILTEAGGVPENPDAAARCTNTPMVPVFQLPRTSSDSLSADRDAQKRDERIRSLLNERGALRVLGALARPELADAISGLYRSHPNFKPTIDYVIGEEMLARQKEEALCGLRLLLIGGPGVGKTDFALSLAKLLDLPCRVISMSSAQSSSGLGGSEVHWGNTKPGAIWECLVQGNVANPIFILDEVEKAADNWGDPLGALYQLLEPKTAATFVDKSVPWISIDASRLNWIATANDPARLHEAIRSRFVEILVGAPPEDSLRALVQGLYSSLLDEFCLEERFPACLSRSAETVLINWSIRDAKRLLRAALGHALRNGTNELVVTADAAPASDRRIGFV